jgi:hypothetical protein
MEKNSLTFHYIQNPPLHSQPCLDFGSDADPPKTKVLLFNVDNNAFFKFQIPDI